MTLRGHVHTFYEKQLSGSVARRVAGVVGWSTTWKLLPSKIAPTRLPRGQPGRRERGLIVVPGFAGITDSDPVLPGVKE